MIHSSQQGRISDAKMKGKPGYDANESRFGGATHELRERKSLVVPGLNGALRVDQGWTQRAQRRDVLMLTAVGEESMTTVVVSREDLEQALFYFAQGDEVIKYTNPKITKSYAMLQREQKKQNDEIGRVRVGS